MKKFFYSVLLAIMPVVALSLASCSNDDDLPDVSIDLQVENGTMVDGTIYVVQGDTLNVTGIYVTNNDAGKDAAITNVRYYVDGYFIGESPFSPYPAYCITDAETPVGNYDLGVACTVLAPDKSIASAALSYPFRVVKSAEDIPGGSSRSAVATRTISLK